MTVRPPIAWIVAAAVTTLVTAAILFLPIQNYYTGILAYAAVLGLLGLSVTLTLGYIGYISFGHAAFFGLGAYTAGLLAVKASVPFWFAVPIAILPGVLLGALVGFASIRVGGAYFAIATLTVSEILRLVALNWMDLTRGPLGVLVPRPRIAALAELGLDFQRYYLLICVACLALTVIGLSRLLRSPYGRAWLAIREASDLAESVGIPTLRYRVINIAISGGLAGLAGALFVPKILVLTPDLFNPMMSATGLLVAILGGKATLIGPILGGLVFAILPEALRFIDQYRIAVFAILLLLVVRLQPGGIMAMLPKRWTARKSQTPIDGAANPGEATVTTTEALRIDGLGRSFGGLRAVHDVSFEVRPGELLGLIGPNGAGKTTCLTLISGFTAPGAGRVRLGDADLGGLAPNVVADLGVVRTFQQTLLCGQLSPFENVLMGTHRVAPEGFLACLIQGKAFRERERKRAASASECLALVGLTDRAATRAADLPYGEQKMLSIAVALASRPGMLLLDEPAAGLNHTEAMRLSELLKRLRDRGLTLLVVDHNLRMMMQLCDRIVVLHLGEKLAEGTPAEVRANPEVVRAYLGDHATVLPSPTAEAAGA